mgnify:CR=1 FL=1
MAHKINESIFIDHMGKLHEEKDMKYLFVMVDRFSAFMVAEPVPDLKAATTADAVCRCWCNFIGSLKAMMSNGGSAFESAEMKCMTDDKCLLDRCLHSLYYHRILTKHLPMTHSFPFNIV